MTSAQIDTIQALEADNNRLKGEIKMKEELIPGMEKMIAYLHKIQQENKQLKEENKELKQNLIEKTKSHLTECQLDLLKTKKIDELEEEKKKLKGECEATALERDGALKDIKTVWSVENKNLRDQLKTMEDIHSGDMKIVKMLREKWNEEQEKNKKLKEEIKPLKEYCDKWSPILTDIDGDDFCNLLCDYGWEYNDEFELVRTY